MNANLNDIKKLIECYEERTKQYDIHRSDGMGSQIRVFADMLSDTLNGTFRNNEVSERMLDNLAIFCSNYLYGIAQEVEGLFNLARSGQSLHLNLKKEIK